MPVDNLNPKKIAPNQFELRLFKSEIHLNRHYSVGGTYRILYRIGSQMKILPERNSF